MDTGFIWDEDKYNKVTSDHNVLFYEVVSAFDDENAYHEMDQIHEGRIIMIAQTHSGRLLYIVYSEEDLPLYRLITAFDAPKEWESVYHDSP